MDHPPYEDLVLLHSGELDPDRTGVVEAHLISCKACGVKYARLDGMYSLVAGSARKRSYSGLAKKGAAVALTAIVTVYLLTSGTASARADNLLTRATAEERKTSARRKIVQVQSGELTCHFMLESGTTSALSGGRDCDALSTTIRQSGWEAHDLLSARKFQQWRQDVPHKQDSVEESRGEIRVTTETSAGAVRLASLRIRTSDYRPVFGHYEFATGDAGRRTVEVAEMEKLPPGPEVTEHPTAEPSAPAVPAAAPPVDPIDPADRREAQVRTILHEAGADGNVLVAIDRNGADLRVWGVTRDDRIKETLTRRLSQLGGVAIALASENEQQQAERPAPWNPAHGDAPALAQKQIDAMYPNQPEARQQYLNGLDRLARDIAGAARDREAVRALLTRIPDTPEALRLNAAAAHLDQRTAQYLGSLRRELSPLLATQPDASADPRETLTAADALELYNLVQRLAILSIHGDPLSLDDALSRLAALLTRK